MKIDYDLLQEFIDLPSHRKSFLVLDSIHLTQDDKIIFNYRAPFTEKIIIPISDYLSKLRDIKLNILLN